MSYSKLDFDHLINNYKIEFENEQKENSPHFQKGNLSSDSALISAYLAQKSYETAIEKSLDIDFIFEKPSYSIDDIQFKVNALTLKFDKEIISILMKKELSIIRNYVILNLKNHKDLKKLLNNFSNFTSHRFSDFMLVLKLEKLGFDIDILKDKQYSSDTVNSINSLLILEDYEIINFLKKDFTETQLIVIIDYIEKGFKTDFITTNIDSKVLRTILNYLSTGVDISEYALEPYNFTRDRLIVLGDAHLYSVDISLLIDKDTPDSYCCSIFQELIKGK